MITLNNEKLPVIKNHLTIVYCTVYRLIRSVTLIKSIGSAKPRKARVINFKARAKPKARALKITGLFSITTFIRETRLCPQEAPCQFLAKGLQKWISESYLKFRKTALKIMAPYEYTWKFPLPGWRAWRNRFFSILNFFDSGHFLVHFLRSHGSKHDRSQKSYINDQ